MIITTRQHIAISAVTACAFISCIVYSQIELRHLLANFQATSHEELIHHKASLSAVKSKFPIPGLLFLLNFYFMFLMARFYGSQIRAMKWIAFFWMLVMANMVLHLLLLVSMEIEVPIIAKTFKAPILLVVTSFFAVYLSRNMLQLKAKKIHAEKVSQQSFEELGEIKKELHQALKELENMQSNPQETQNLRLKTKKNTTKEKQFVDKLNSIIDEYIANPDLDCKFLSEKMHMSEKTLSRRIASSQNSTPGAYLRKKRLEKALQLMEECNERSAKELALSVGFKSTVYFKRIYNDYLEEYQAEP